MEKDKEIKEVVKKIKKSETIKDKKIEKEAIKEKSRKEEPIMPYDEKKDIEENKLMAVLSYIVPPIPYFMNTTSKFVKFHAKEGMNLFMIAIIYAIISGVLTSIIKVNADCFGIPNCYRVTPLWVTLPINLIWIALFVLVLIGIINVCNEKEKKLPYIDKIRIIK